jgi:hypothetical protein
VKKILIFIARKIFKGQKKKKDKMTWHCKYNFNI